MENFYKENRKRIGVFIHHLAQSSGKAIQLIDANGKIYVPINERKNKTTYPKLLKALMEQIKSEPDNFLTFRSSYAMHRFGDSSTSEIFVRKTFLFRKTVVEKDADYCFIRRKKDNQFLFGCSYTIMEEIIEKVREIGSAAALSWALQVSLS